MKHKLNFFKYLFCCTPFLGTFFTSCSENVIIPPGVNITITAEHENMFAFSNTGFYSTGVQYKIDLSGDIQNSDILELQINNQNVDGEPVYYLYVPIEYQQILLDSSTTSITFPIEQFAFAPNDIFLLDFDLVVRVIRNDDVVYRNEINDFLYCNATPTFDDMFLVDEQNVNRGLDLSQSWVLYQLEKCNMFLQPSKVVSIDDNVFFDGVKSLLPDSIQCINLSTSNDYLHITNNLKTIGANVFKSSNAKHLILPKTLETIKANAFADCNQLRLIDLSLIDAIPTMWEDNVFNNVIIPENAGTVYINDSQSVDDWKNYFQVHEPNSNISTWDFKVIQIQ